MNIKVIGSHSANRMKLIKNVNKALKEHDFSVILEIIDDEETLSNYRDKNTPILIINNKIISTGKILEPREIKKYIEVMK